MRSLIVSMILFASSACASTHTTRHQRAGFAIVAGAVAVGAGAFMLASSEPCQPAYVDCIDEEIAVTFLGTMLAVAGGGTAIGGIIGLLLPESPPPTGPKAPSRPQAPGAGAHFEPTRSHSTGK